MSDAQARRARWTEEPATREARTVVRAGAERG